MNNNVGTRERENRSVWLKKRMSEGVELCSKDIGFYTVNILWIYLLSVLGMTLEITY